MKIKRHSAILNLIANYDIEKQEDLCEKLEEAGFNVTQATVSRDIKELRLVKVQGKDGNYKYSASTKEQETVLSSKFNSIFSEAVIKIDFAGNFIVIKCYPGMAHAAAATIDSMNINEIVGTLAGDDTVFLLMRSEDNAAELTKSLIKYIK